MAEDDTGDDDEADVLEQVEEMFAFYGEQLEILLRRDFEHRPDFWMRRVHLLDAIARENGPESGASAARFAMAIRALLPAPH